MSLPNLLIATENQNKLKEFQEIFGLETRLFSLKELAPKLSLPAEGVESYEANAIQKAVFVGTETKVMSLGDDSGFEVEALQWGPGVISARFAGTSDAGEQRQEILRQIQNSQSRAAKFVCVLALYDPASKKTSTYRGEVRGSVSLEERGNNGFGYDSIFIPDGYSQTFGELSTQIKNQISHRARAINELKKQWLIDPSEHGASLRYFFDPAHPSRP